MGRTVGGRAATGSKRLGSEHPHTPPARATQSPTYSNGGAAPSAHAPHRGGGAIIELGLTWEIAPEEYAIGLNRLVANRELEENFGSRWRLNHQGDFKKGHIILCSERAALYRAFDTECLRRGRDVGVDGTLSTLKQKYSGERNSKDVPARVGKDYLSGGAAWTAGMQDS